MRQVFQLHKRGLSLREIARAVGKAHTSVAEILRHRDEYHGGVRGASQVRWPRILSS